MQSLIMHIGLIYLFISATGCLFGQDTDLSETIEKENILRFGYSNSNGIKYQQYKSLKIFGFFVTLIERGICELIDLII